MQTNSVMCWWCVHRHRPGQMGNIIESVLFVDLLRAVCVFTLFHLHLLQTVTIWLMFWQWRNEQNNSHFIDNMSKCWLFVSFSIFRGDSAFTPGSLVVAWRRASGLPDHQWHTGSQHGSAPVHWEHLPQRTTVPISYGRTAAGGLWEIECLKHIWSCREIQKYFTLLWVVYLLFVYLYFINFCHCHFLFYYAKPAL